DVRRAPAGLASRCQHDLGDAGEGAGAADGDVDMVPAPVAHDRRQIGTDIGPAGVDLRRPDRVAREEPAGETDGPELHAEGVDHMASLAHQELGAATADVDEE